MTSFAAFGKKELPSLPECLKKLAGELKKRFPDYPDEGSAEERLAADRALVDSGQISEPELLHLYNSSLALDSVDEDEFQTPDPFPGLSQEYLNRSLLLLAEWSEDGIICYAADPYKLAQYAYDFKRMLSLDTSFKLLRRTFLERMLTRVYQSHDEQAEELSRDEESTLRHLAGEARIVRLVNDIFTRALEMSASDIHVEPGEDNVSVRCRVDGVLTEILTCPLSQFPAISSRIKLIGGLNIAESRLPQDGRTNFHLGKTELDMRISTIPILTGESIVLRLLNKEAVAFDLRVLGMGQEMLERFQKLISIPYGIILVVGPTGSGKTTTLYSVINQLNDHKKKIITIEDPVEYQMPGLSQMQVNDKIGVTFAAGLRHIVRQDPDIILVGEIRDRETADIAINAALTGHLVLSTLHTNDAVGAVARLVDMGVEPFLIASALFGVLSQRLVRRICPECSGAGADTAGNRCKRCSGAGFKGRGGIFELMAVNDELRHAITANLPSMEVAKIAERNGMVALREDGLKKVADGFTTMEELQRSTADI